MEVFLSFLVHWIVQTAIKLLMMNLSCPIKTGQLKPNKCPQLSSLRPVLTEAIARDNKEQFYVGVYFAITFYNSWIGSSLEVELTDQIPVSSTKSIQSWVLEGVSLKK